MPVQTSFFFMKKQQGKLYYLNVPHSRMERTQQKMSMTATKNCQEKKKGRYSDVSKATGQIIKQCAFISPELIPSISAQEP